jgi:hypothetical protein
MPRTPTIGSSRPLPLVVANQTALTTKAAARLAAVTTTMVRRGVIISRCGTGHAPHSASAQLQPFHHADIVEMMRRTAGLPRR